MLSLPGEAEGRMSRRGGLWVPGQSPCRPRSAGQGCRGSEVEQTFCRPAGTKGPATENGDTSALPKAGHPWPPAVALRSPILKSFKKVESIVLSILPVGNAECPQINYLGLDLNT